VTGERHNQLMRDEKVRCHLVRIAQETRESFSAHELSSGHDFRFVLPGPVVSASDYDACFSYVVQHMPKQFLVISGGLAPGVPTDFYARLTALAKSRGVRVVLDTNGPALHAALKEGVFLFKPSLRELRDLTGQALPDLASRKTAAQQLIHEGQAEVVAVSLGEEGAMLVTATQAWLAPALKVDIQTTIGAGDSFVGGMVWALSEGMAVETAFQAGIAAGAAALMAPGTSLSQAVDVFELMKVAGYEPV
jgi:6-phosphofructokinase 2